MIRVMDLFSGCGGLSLGFENADYEIVAAFDKWSSAVDVYRANFDHPIHEIDFKEMQNFSIFDQYEVDMIIGGPPCQDFSSAGLRDETQGRADLTYKFAEIVLHVRPRYFLMENVDRITKSNVLKITKKLLQDAGYGLSQIVLNASHCGVPQNRKRFFLFGELEGENDILTPYCDADLSDEPMTVFDYLGDSLGIEHYYRHPRSYARRGVFSIHEPSPTVRGVNRPIPSTYQTHRGDTSPVTPELRALTTKERSLIQTFPPDFELDGTKTDLEQMIGNAVPVNQARYVALCIKKYLQDKADYTVIEVDKPEQLKIW